MLFWDGSNVDGSIRIITIPICSFFTYGLRAANMQSQNSDVFYSLSQNCEKRLVAASCLSVCPHGTTRLLLDGFFKIWYLSNFRKSVEKIPIFLKNRTRITGILHEDQYTFFIISRPVLLKMRIISDKNCKENQNIFYVTYFFFRKNCLLWDNVEIYCRAGQATVDNMAHAYCMLDT